MSAIYVASACRWRRVAAGIAQVVREEHTVTSSWLDGPEKSDDELDEGAKLRVLQQCLADVSRSDCLLVLAYLGEPRMTLVEAGFALAMGKPCVWVHLAEVGKCIVTAHPKVVALDIEPTIDASIAELGGYWAPSVQPFQKRVHAAIREALTR